MHHPALGQLILAYSPVIDRNRAVIATRLTLSPINPDAPPSASAALEAMAQAWPSDSDQLWLNVTHEGLLMDLLQANPGRHMIMEIPAFMACDARYTDAICTLHANGGTLVLKGRPLSDLPKEVLPCFKHAIVDLSEDRRADGSHPPTTAGAPAVYRGISVVQSGVCSVDDMEASFRRGVAAVLGWPIDSVTQAGNKPADQPALQVIVQLIDQVHRQDEIEDLEATIKRDPPLAYKLMRYINSPAFGLSVEISSFRHAIMILGYNRLKRWLALLLATASKDPNMRPVMYASVRRGLLMEELGRCSGNDELRSELFICGVFSLLDRMFRQPFSELLRTIPVPEQVFQALAEHTGPYEPYFQMVQAIENGIVYDIREAAEGLMLSFDDINAALLRAMNTASQLD
jgi:EAL and modified HD-GYP domain-containing signal transduction protein